MDVKGTLLMNCSLKNFYLMISTYFHVFRWILPLVVSTGSPIDLPYVGSGTHEGKNIFGVTVEFTPATTAANFKLHYIEDAFEKKEGIFECVC